MRSYHLLTRFTIVMIAVSVPAHFSDAGLAWGQKLKPRQPVVSTRAVMSAPLALGTPSGSTLTVTPAPGISANKPGASQSSQTVSLTFYDSSSATTGNNTYSISLWATATNFNGTGCPTVPANAITVSCAPGSAAGVGANKGTAPCSSVSSFTLPTTQPPSGNLQNAGVVGNKSGNYTASLTFSITDDYKYFATLGGSCALILNYSVTTQ